MSFFDVTVSVEILLAFGLVLAGSLAFMPDFTLDRFADEHATLIEASLAHYRAKLFVQRLGRLGGIPHKRDYLRHQFA